MLHQPLAEEYFKMGWQRNSFHISSWALTESIIFARNMYRDWETTYESLSDMVVPRCTERVHEDSEYGLYTVTVFKKVTEEFKLHAREKKYVDW